MQQETEDDLSGLVGRAEHLPRQEVKCQAEQQNHQEVRDCQADQQDKVRDQPEQTEGRDQLNQSIVQPEAEEDWSELVGQAEHLRRPETEGQTEQQKHQRLEEHRAEPLDPQPGIGSQAEHQHRAGDWKDQAEKRDRGDEEEQTLGVTQNIRQSSAILDAVARYVGVPISNNHVPTLNDNNSGGGDCQAEHWNQVQPEAEEDRSGSGNQAEPLRGSEARCQAEQQNHPTVQPEAEDAWGGSVSRAEHLLRQEVKCQAEQQNHQSARDCQNEQAEGRDHWNPHPEMKCQAEHQRRAGNWIAQAEEGDRGDEKERIIGVTQKIRQSSTILDAVARYVGVPISDNHVPILTENN